MIALQPMQVNSMILKNRLLLPPMGTRKAEADGTVNRAILEHYAEKSAGGYFSLIVVEHSYVNLEGKASNNQLSVSDDGMIAGLSKLAEAIHRNGCRAMVQINHAGSNGDSAVSGMPVVGPSAIPNPRRSRGMPRELIKGEIDDLILAFRDAALRVQKAGFDGVEIHSAHGYLLNQFLSPLSNQRTDEYGGSIENRIRLHVRIVRAVREAVGKDYPIFVRLGAADYMQGGTTAEEGAIAARAVEKAGADAIDVSGGFCMYTLPGKEDVPGYFAPLSETVRRAIDVPVVLTGGVRKIQSAEELLETGKADLIGIGRAMLEDSNWAKNEFESLA